MPLRIKLFEQHDNRLSLDALAFSNVCVPCVCAHLRIFHQNSKAYKSHEEPIMSGSKMLKWKTEITMRKKKKAHTNVTIDQVAMLNAIQHFNLIMLLLTRLYNKQKLCSFAFKTFTMKLPAISEPCTDFQAYFPNVCTVFDCRHHFDGHMHNLV